MLTFKVQKKVHKINEFVFILKVHKSKNIFHNMATLGIANPSAKRVGLVTAVLCSCTILPKTGTSNQIVVFSIKTFS